MKISLREITPENAAAEKLYKSLGFERTGETDGKEIVMRFAF